MCASIAYSVSLSLRAICGLWRLPGLSGLSGLCTQHRETTGVRKLWAYEFLRCRGKKFARSRAAPRRTYA